MKNDLIAVKGVCLANSSCLRDFFEINKDGKEFEIAGDTVITSMGYHPKPALEGAKLIGDCKKVGNLRTVVWGAWKVAMKI